MKGNVVGINDCRWAFRFPTVIPIRPAVPVLYPAPVITIVKAQHDAVLNPVILAGVKNKIKVKFSGRNWWTVGVFFALDFKCCFFFAPLSNRLQKDLAAPRAAFMAALRNIAGI